MKKPLLIGSLFVALLTVPSTASADFSFDDACAPEVSYDLLTLNPNVLLIVDRSASMNDGSGEDVDGGGEDSKFKVARLSIADMATANHADGACAMPGDAGCDDVRLGVGYYAGNSYSSSPDTYDSFVDVAPGDDTRDPIIASVNATNAPGGSGTTTGDAAARIATDMTDTTRSNVGVIVTDGETTGSSQQRRAVEQLCLARDRASAPVTTYIVGFGSGSDAEENSLLAAAGGTGVCCESDSPPCDAEDQRDPCDEAPNNVYNADNTRTGITNGWDCEGSIEADGSGLKDALEVAFEGAECSFALSIPADYPTNSAQANPGATRVRVEMPAVAAGVLDLPHISDPDDPDSNFSDYLEDAWGVGSAIADSYADEGWYFTNTERRRVTLTPGLCEAVRNGEVTQVLTQVACICELTGEECTVTEGFDGFTNEQLEKMRCTRGVYQCIAGEDVCVSDDDPLPEICNGIDDNCDGITDNLDSGQDAWEAWEALDASNDTRSLHCNYQSVCVCDGDPDELAPGGASLQEHLDSWTGACVCGEGLAPESSNDPAPVDSPKASSQAACSASQGQAAGTMSLLILAFIGAFWRNRRR